jgi:hypothetical protein
VVAQLCLARQALRASDAKPKEIIESFVKSAGGKEASAPALLAASLLALDTGARRLHDQYRQTFLGKYATDPTMWTATSFLLDRYLRYWLYHPPYTAGWTYGRRQGHFLAIGTPEEAQRKFETELKTLNGETVKIPESSDGKWTVISFVPTAAGNGYLQRYASFVSVRPFQDTNLIVAVLDDDVETADKLLKEKAAELEKRRQQPETFPTLLVPGGLQNPIVRKLGMITDDEKPKNNILMLRPDGSIAVALSGLTMGAQKGSVIQNVIEFHDEEMIDKALAKGDLDEAKRLAFRARAGRAGAPGGCPPELEAESAHRPSPTESGQGLFGDGGIEGRSSRHSRSLSQGQYHSWLHQHANERTGRNRSPQGHHSRRP